MEPAFLASCVSPDTLMGYVDILCVLRFYILPTQKKSGDALLSSPSCCLAGEVKQCVENVSDSTDDSGIVLMLSC